MVFLRVYSPLLFFFSALETVTVLLLQFCCLRGEKLHYYCLSCADFNLKAKSYSEIPLGEMMSDVAIPISVFLHEAFIKATCAYTVTVGALTFQASSCHFFSKMRLGE